MRILCLGDSNTWGYDSRSLFGDRYPSNIRWTGILNRSDHTVINLGMNGMCVPAAAQLDWITGVIKKELPVDRVIVMLGTNNLLRNDSAQQTGSDLLHLLETLKTMVPAERILLIAPVTLQKGTWVEGESMIRASEQFSEVCRAVSETAGTAFLDASKWQIPLLYDGVHFTEEGHAKFAEQVLRKLNESEGAR